VRGKIHTLNMQNTITVMTYLSTDIMVDDAYVYVYVNFVNEVILHDYINFWIEGRLKTIWSIS
jgi:multisubunit Na+/H+ antiporter MnhF subunit